MKPLYYLSAILLFVACQSKDAKKQEATNENPFNVELNQPVDFNQVTGDEISDYANSTLEKSKAQIERIRNSKATFDNVCVKLDRVFNDLNTASNYSFMLYWVSPDSLSRVKGLESYQEITKYQTKLSTDKSIYDKIVEVSNTDEYAGLVPHRKRLVDNMIMDFKRAGVNLEADKLEKYKELSTLISELSAEYSNNMNSANLFIDLDKNQSVGLPENLLNTYKQADGTYKIPVMNATSRTVLNNAADEGTRKDYYYKFNNIAADKNLEILKQLVDSRYEMAQLMGYKSYAEYNLTAKMAKNPETVWNFINDLVDRSKEKAYADLDKLQQLKKQDANVSDPTLMPWDISYYTNQILKNEYKVDHEKIREYLQMDKCLEGVLALYEKLLNYKFEKVENPKVWHPEVEMYNVMQDGKLVGRFYLDLFPRPNKESWFYGVGITTGCMTDKGYQVPSSMLLGNFTRATDDLPSLISFKELNTLFHEFGHIMDAMSYRGEFSSQSGAKSDFIESMSQIFENWTMDYDMLSTFAMHYKTGEVLPREMFENLEKSHAVGAGYKSLSSLRRCIYDMNLYDKYNPEFGLDTDGLWMKIDEQLGLKNMYVRNTHPQASWIHINTHPVYYYGYLWAEVYAQDMFTVFEQNGLFDQPTGVRFRDLILANGDQADVVPNVEEFLGRPSNNEAYIKSLGLE